MGSTEAWSGSLREDAELVPLYVQASMSNALFDQLQQFIHEYCGVNLSRAKKPLLEGRLRKRLRHLGLDSFKDYCAYLFSPGGLESEVGQLIDVVTTHKTDFFREPRHFEYLTQELLPGYFQTRQLPGRELRVWSAACSTGEEPYTIAMVLSEYAFSVQAFRYSLLASDVSRAVLEIARIGIYDEARIEPIPPPLRKRYLLRSKDSSLRQVRIAPEVRASICFRQVNLMEPFPLASPMDIIFCRNALIYFDREGQEKVIQQFYDALAPGGYLFLGHSETLSGLRVPFDYKAATIYHKPVEDDASQD